jgi:hypothetical protein
MLISKGFVVLSLLSRHLVVTFNMLAHTFNMLQNRLCIYHRYSPNPITHYNKSNLSNEANKQKNAMLTKWGQLLCFSDGAHGAQFGAQ